MKRWISAALTLTLAVLAGAAPYAGAKDEVRSEERRVGKEGRVGGCGIR